jgi:cytochrome c oxidase subunit 2
MRNRKHYVAVTILIAVVSVLLYLLLQVLYPLPTAASAEAGTIDTMFRVYFGLIAFMFSLIMVFMLYAAFAFRRRPDDTEDAVHIHGNTTLEIVWTILPVILVITLGVWGATTLNALTASESGEMVIEVTGQQWVWGFAYPEYDNLTSGELVLPVNQPIVLKMQSNDVLHSFWVPEFRVKQDLVPGRVTELRITPTEIGQFTLRCAEICGLNHTSMLADVRVLDQAAFDAWIEEKSQAPVLAELSPQERGEIWYGVEDGFGCLACHTVDGSSGVGPSWLGLYGRVETLDDGSTVTAEADYISRSILMPNEQLVAGYPANVMPQDYEMRFADKQAEVLASEGIEVDIIEDLIAFIQTLEE